MEKFCGTHDETGPALVSSFGLVVFLHAEFDGPFLYSDDVKGYKGFTRCEEDAIATGEGDRSEHDILL